MTSDSPAVNRVEILPDDEPLRRARRTRVLDAMDAADIDILIVGREANARYVSGVRRLWTAGSRPFGPGCVLMRDGSVHLLSTWDEGVPDDIPREHLYGISFNSESFLRVLSNLPGAATARTVATDSLTPGGARMLGTAFPAAEIIDGERILRQVRAVKLPAEVDAIRASVAIAERALESAVRALRPGTTERRLTGVFMEAMASAGITTPATQDVAWITSRTDPWRRSSRDATVAAGDLVAFDAGVIADGYFGEVGRTVLVGDDAAATELLRRGDDLFDRLISTCRAGTPTRALLDAYADAGVAEPPMPVARGLGLGFDTPLVSHALPSTAGDQRLEAGMVLSLASFVWEAGTGAAYRLEPVVVTDTGADLLSTVPSPVAAAPNHPNPSTQETP